MTYLLTLRATNLRRCHANGVPIDQLARLFAIPAEQVLRILGGALR